MRIKLIKVVSVLLAITLLTIAATVVVTADTTADPFSIDSKLVTDANGDVIAITVEVTSNIDNGCHALKGEFTTATKGLELTSITVDVNDPSEGTKDSDIIIVDKTTGNVTWFDFYFDNDGKVVVTATYEVADGTAIAPGTYALTFTPTVYVDGDSDKTHVELEDCVLTATVKVCADTDNDHYCDACNAKLSDCVDEDPADHKCDICRKIFTTCVDKNPADYKCDICGAQVGTPPVTPPATGLKGDVDLDKDVDMDDLTYFAEHIAKIITITDSQSLENAEVTGEGEVTMDDLTKLAEYIAKIIPDLD